MNDEEYESVREEEHEDDVYDEDTENIDDEEMGISPEEQAFMSGYRKAGSREEEEEED